ncbi:MAG: DUF6776 family protein [Gammaproteobacteria bacterium]|jgi:hypothetical protein|nr:DUF6776 family protein [Gammaproteobacteria bacterium]
MARSRVVVASRPLLGAPLVLGLLVIVTLTVGWLAFDAGLKRAGYNRAAAAATQRAAARRIAELETANEQLSERIAVLETASTVDREAYRQVESQLIELQDKILAQQEDIEFYRGIVGPDDGSRLRIQDFVVRPARRAGDFELQLVLAQALRSRGEVEGAIDLEVDGQLDGAPTRLELAQLRADQAGGELSYSFRYFQDLKVRVRLPAGFTPERVHVLVRPAGKAAKTVEDFFVWRVESG